MAEEGTGSLLAVVTSLAVVVSPGVLYVKVSGAVGRTTSCETVWDSR